MADENAGLVEYGRMAYIGPSPGTVEYGRLPAVGSACILAIQSSPDTGVSIDVNPPDINGESDGTTTFSRSYDLFTDVALTAPLLFNGNNFLYWSIDGVPDATNPISFVITGDQTAIAVYLPPEPFVPIPGVEMLKNQIPRYKYWKSAPTGETSYPNLEDGIEGRPIAEAYGILTNITPICVDTEAGVYKIARRAIQSIDEIRDGETVLVEGVDYEEDLINGEFTLLTTPLLEGGGTYYFVLESDYTINGSDYLKFGQGHNHYSRNRFEIDGSGVWTEIEDYSFEFLIMGRDSASGKDRILVDGYWSGGMTTIKLRDAAARTRLAQEFVLPSGGPYYITGIKFHNGIEGAPSESRISRIQILSAYISGETPVGMKSNRIEDDPNHRAIWPIREGGSSEILVDVHGYYDGSVLIENVADVLYDIYVNVLGGSTSGLNASDLANLATARIADVALYISEAEEFQHFMEIFESGHLFKILPSLDGDFAVRCLTSGEPAGTPHLKSEHIANLSMKRIWRNVYQIAKVKYYKNPTTDDWLIAEEKSGIAAYLYNRQTTIEIETALKDAADATQLAEDYLGIDGVSTRKVNLQYPSRIAEFDVLAGYGFNLIPTMKVKLTLPRADYDGGSLDGVLFRIMEIRKNPENGTSRIVSMLDSLTY